MKYNLSIPLQAIMEERKYSIHRMSSALGYTLSYTTNICAGSVFVGITAARRIAASLNVPVKALIGFSPENGASPSYPDSLAPLPPEKQCGIARVLEILNAESGVGYLDPENTIRCNLGGWVSTGARRRGCHYISEATAAGGGQG